MARDMARASRSDHVVTLHFDRNGLKGKPPRDLSEKTAISRNCITEDDLMIAFRRYTYMLHWGYSLGICN